MSDPVVKAVTIQLADAMVAALNAAVDEGEAFGDETFTAVRRTVPKFALEDLKDLTVVVCPRSRDDQMHTRGSNLLEIKVDVGVLKKLDGNDAAIEERSDELALLCERIIAFFNQRRLEQMPSATWNGSALQAVVDAEAYAKERLFRSAVTLTYNVVI